MITSKRGKGKCQLESKVARLGRAMTEESQEAEVSLP